MTWACFVCRQPYDEGYSLRSCGPMHQFRPLLPASDVQPPILDHSVPRDAMLLAAWGRRYMRGAIRERVN